MTALSGLRILDLTDLKGALCAKLFGDMGADVIKIEPPQGDASRRIGPFLDGQPHRRGNVSSTRHEDAGHVASFRPESAVLVL